MTDPATLIDCPNCDAVNDPFEIYCWNCKQQCVSDKRKQQLEDCEKYFNRKEVVSN